MLHRLRPPAVKISAAVLVAVFLFSTAHGAAVTWVCSTEQQPWQIMPAPALEKAHPAALPQVRAWPEKTFQSIDGFGGCFNEMGWIALNRTAPANRDRVLAALFSDDGCAFNLGRIPIGASDFATNAYSLDDTPGDLALTNFSLARDEENLIPFVQAAMAVRPALQCWGSAWSPPAWMKTNDNYSKGSLKWEPEILRCYANYLARWVEAYRADGVNVFAVFTQNEPNIASPYPSCLWTGPQLREFVADYLGPTLRHRKTQVQLWLGTLNGDPFNDGDNANDRLVTVMSDPRAAKFITGISFQYDSKNILGSARVLYPDKKLMQSETECLGGANSWNDALHLYGLMKRYLENGAGSYFAWNMVLDDTGLSHWGWKQNALITIRRDSGAVTFNGEYYVMRHFSEFIKPGAHRVLTTGNWGDQIAFVDPDGSTVLVVANSAQKSYPVTLAAGDDRDGGTVTVTLPARSVNTLVIPR